MKKLFILSAAIIHFILFSFKSATPAQMASDVEGSFKTFDATITTTGDDFTGATFDFGADAASITTDNERRDKNIKNVDFRRREIPQTNFQKYFGNQKKNTTYKITGNLTLHGITKAIALDAMVRIPPEATGVKGVAAFKVTGIIRRSDFNIGAGFADVMLGEEITLNANGEFKRTDCK